MSTTIYTGSEVETFDGKELSVLKYEAITLIREIEKKKINSGITYNSHKFDSDEKSQKFITSLLTSVNAGIITEIEGFTTYDNEDIALSASDIINLAGLLLAHISACHSWKRGKLVLVDNATTKEELEAIYLDD